MAEYQEANQANADLKETVAVTNDRYGHRGISTVTIIGLSFVATEARIATAVLGVAGLGGPSRSEDEAVGSAAALTCGAPR